MLIFYAGGEFQVTLGFITLWLQWSKQNHRMFSSQTLFKKKNNNNNKMAFHERFVSTTNPVGCRKRSSWNSHFINLFHFFYLFIYSFFFLRFCCSHTHGYIWSETCPWISFSAYPLLPVLLSSIFSLPTALHIDTVPKIRAQCQLEYNFSFMVQAEISRKARWTSSHGIPLTLHLSLLSLNLHLNPLHPLTPGTHPSQNHSSHHVDKAWMFRYQRHATGTCTCSNQVIKKNKISLYLRFHRCDWIVNVTFTTWERAVSLLSHLRWQFQVQLGTEGLRLPTW